MEAYPYFARRTRAEPRPDDQVDSRKILNLVCGITKAQLRLVANGQRRKGISFIAAQSLVDLQQSSLEQAPVVGEEMPCDVGGLARGPSQKCRVTVQAGQGHFRNWTAIDVWPSVGAERCFTEAQV